MNSPYAYLFMANLYFLAAFLMMMMSDSMADNIFAILFLSTAAIFMLTAFRVSKRKRLAAYRVSKRKRLTA